jgi:hypothetical protein
VIVEIGWWLSRIVVTGDICLSRGKGPLKAVEPMMKMMRRRRNRRRKTKARIVTSNNTLNSLMKINVTVVVCKGIKFH